MMRKITFFGMVILVVIFSGLAVSRSFAQAKLSDFEEIDAYISTKMDELDIPGAALVIVQGDQIVHIKAFGVADADGRPVTPQTPFFTGSTGKSFTALAIMQLVEAGKVKLDVPVQTYLPWFRVADSTASEVITVRQLLNQTSGLPVSIGREQLANTDLSDSVIENNVRALANVELIAPPGKRYEYSNANYVTLGMVIQAVTGQSYETYIRENIYKPLDMQNSFTSKTEAQQNGLAVGYQKWFGMPVASPNLPFVRGSLPAGELNMSAEDFGHYLIAQRRQKMKAMVYTKYGSPDVLQHQEVETPVPKDNEILIRIHATAVTAGDVRMRSFAFLAFVWPLVRIMYGIRKPRHTILGHEFAGEIESVGKEVKQFRRNDPV